MDISEKRHKYYNGVLYRNIQYSIIFPGNDVLKKQRKKIIELRDGVPKTLIERKCIFLGHLGLGDYMTCNGIVRYLVTIYDEVLVVIKKGIETFKFMYRDNPNIKIHKVEKDSSISPNYGASKEVLKDFENKGYEVLLSGYHINSNFIHPITKVNYPVIEDSPIKIFWCDFYFDFGLEYQASRYIYEYYERDLERERTLAEKIYSDYDKGGYRLIIQDHKVGYVLNKILNKEIMSNSVILDLDPSNNHWSDNVFDYGLIIEKAEEIYLYDSSFFCMLRMLKGKNNWKSINVKRRADDDLKNYIGNDYENLIKYI